MTDVFDNCFLLKNTIEPACIIEDKKNKLKTENITIRKLSLPAGLYATAPQQYCY